MSKTFVITALLALAEARFGQEQAVASIVSALSSFGQPGQAATLAGATPGVLLAGANACDKLTLADKIVAQLGTDAQVIAAAAAVVAAEKNFNPFVVSIPSLCSDVKPPATPELRGIVALVDPAVIGSDVENANSATSLKTPFNADRPAGVSRTLPRLTVSPTSPSRDPTGPPRLEVVLLPQPRRPLLPPLPSAVEP